MDYNLFLQITNGMYYEIYTDVVRAGHIFKHIISEKKYRVLFSHPQVVVLETWPHVDEVLIVYDESRIK